MSTRPRLYASVNIGKPQSYYDYENLQISWGRQEDYEIVRKLGRGKYSEVFEGIGVQTSSAVSIKILKPVRKSKVKREIKVLQNLADTKGVPALVDIVRDKGSKFPALILEYCPNEDFKTLYPKLTDFEIRFYLFELLRILDSTHAHGIIHRDVKPSNFMIDHLNRKTRLIDWGLAEFFLPGTPLNVRVASRYYKAPELLVNNTMYDYSLDVWSAGAMMAGMIFKKEPFFHGHDNLDQLVKISRVLGTDDLGDYLEKFSLEIPHELGDMIGQYPKKPLTKFVTPENQHLASPEAIDLVDKILRYDQSERILPKEAIEHGYFEPVRKMWEYVNSGGKGEIDDCAQETARILLNK